MTEPRQLSETPQPPIAIVGIGCRLPGGVGSPDELWRALLEGVDGIRPVPADRWCAPAFHAPEAGRAGSIRAAVGGFLEGVDLFDADFFGYFPSEAAQIDPQQRLLLEVSYEAIADAGVPLETLAGQPVGVFVGSFMYDYLNAQLDSSNRYGIGTYTGMGAAVTGIANRISYCFDLRGPSLTVDTACSSSLVAIHLACQSIWKGESRAALAGGVNLLLRPESSIAMSQGGFLSPDGACNPFSAAANGYVRSEGVGVVYLKPLQQALVDRDEIYALVLGSATNHGGYVSAGFAVPNQRAQEELLRAAYRNASIDPRKVAFVEAHGTGTPVGDPIEAGALGSVLGHGRPVGARCLIGSLKGNFGHLEGASGVAGFIKAALVARHGCAPCNLRLGVPNPVIDFAALGLHVPTANMPLWGSQETTDAPDSAAGSLVVGVNSFGAGGTNAHVVLASYPAPAIAEDRAPRSARLHLFRISARSQPALVALCRDTAVRLSAQDVALADVSYTQLVRSSRHPHSLVLVASTHEELIRQLEQYAAGSRPTAALEVRSTVDAAPQLAFLYSGQGGQWARMGMQLWEQEPVFAEALREVDGYIRAAGGMSILEELGHAHDRSRIDETAIAQPTIFAIQIALTRVLAKYGVRPDAVAGHSIGEVAAAWAAGALSLKDASELIFHRARIQDRASGKGRMLAVGLTREAGQELADRYAGQVCVATVNGPSQLTLAGDALALEQIAAELSGRGLFQRFVNVQVPYHSHYMEPLRAELQATLKPYRGQAATCPLYSSVTAQREPGTHLGAEYLYRNVREPVLFAETVERMLDDGYRVFFEIGPHAVLTAFVREILHTRKLVGTIAETMNRKKEEGATLRCAVGAWLALSERADPRQLVEPGARFHRLARYSFQRQRFWAESAEAAQRRLAPPLHPLLDGVTRLASEGQQQVWHGSLGLGRAPYLADHEIDGATVLPATAHIELALSVGAAAFPAQALCLRALRFETALVLPSDQAAVDLRFEIRNAEGSYAVLGRTSKSQDAESAWTLHSAGRFDRIDKQRAPAQIDLPTLRSKMGEAERIDVAGFYSALHRAGLHYGTSFRGVKECWLRGDELLARIEPPDSLSHDAGRYVLHPALLDAALHSVLVHPHQRGSRRVYLPASIDRVHVHVHKPVAVQGYASHAVFSYVRVRRCEEEISADVFLLDESGQIQVEIEGLLARALRRAEPESRGHEYRFCESARNAPGGIWFKQVPSRVLLLARGSAIRDAVVTELGRQAPGLEVILHSELPTDAGASFGWDLSSVLREARDRRTEILYLAPEPARQKDTSDFSCADDPGGRLLELAGHILSLTRTLLALEYSPSITVVTRRAVGLPGDDGGLDLAQAAQHGLLRVVRNECPSLRLRLIDCSDALPSCELSSLVRELFTSRSDLSEMEIALRGERRYVRELIELEPDAERSESLPACGGAYLTRLREKGVLDSLEFRRIAGPRAVGRDEVEIEVHAAALNFKDVMNALGLLPERAVAGGLTGGRLGLEVAGVVLRTGPEVNDLRPGDEVIARVAEGFVGRSVTPRHCVVGKPPVLSMQEAASLPIAYTTAYYGLHYLARLSERDTVLIHSASGGVGLAAVRLAQRAGARIIASAGSEARRALLRELGIAQVFDSRSGDFFDGVMAATGGRGADVILNSLAGPLFVKSLKCLAPGGRFLELGKTDVYRDRALAIERFADNGSFHVIDVDRLAAQRPELHQQILRSIVELFTGPQPLPGPRLRDFPIRELGGELKRMGRAGHTGKLVARMIGETVPALPPQDVPLRADRSYLVTGGTGGFGLCVAKWLVQQGARHLVLVSRSGLRTALDAEAVDALRAQGGHIVVQQLDVADKDAVLELLKAVQRDGPPLAGIVHSAAVLADARLVDMTLPRFLAALRPKALGAWNLHQATLELGIELEHFVLLSSISAVFGLVGQSNYATANCFLDALAEHRQRLGLRATSVNLGMLGRYAGMWNTQGADALMAQFQNQGWGLMSLAEALDWLRQSFAEQPVQRLAARLDFAQFAKAYPNLRIDARFARLFQRATSRPTAESASRLSERLYALAPDARLAALTEGLCSTLARILGVAPAAVAPEEPLGSLGLDSLMLTQLNNWIYRELGVSLPIMKLLRGPSLRVLAEHILAARSSSEPLPPTPLSHGVAKLPAGLSAASRWLVRGTPTPAVRRLFCFHPVGAGAALFAPILLAPPSELEVLALQAPGRENRANEPHERDFHRLIECVTAALKDHLDRPYVFWGHSFGGLVAFEVLRRLRALGLPQPVHLLLSGTIAPHLAAGLKDRELIQLAEVSDSSLDYLLAISRHVDDPELLRAIFPRLRADLPLLTSYRFEDQPPLDVPITAVAAQHDDLVYPDEIAAWSLHTRARFELTTVRGGHWFLSQEEPLLRSLIESAFPPADAEERRKSR